MNRYTPLFGFLLLSLFIATTGFQCGSTEMTTARLAMQQKQWDKAEQSLLRELQKNESNEEAWFLLGQIRLELKKYQEMNDAYTKALALASTHKQEIDRNRLAVWANLYNEGVGLFNKGRDDASYYDKALASFRTAIMLVPDSAGTYYVSALASYAKKDYKSAIGDLETVLQKDPRRVDAAKLLGQIHFQQGQAKRDEKDEAGAMAELRQGVVAYEKVYAAAPNEVDNLIALIDAYDKTNQSEKALTLTRNCTQQTPTNRVCRYAYGVYLLKQEKYTESIEQFKAAIELDPNAKDELHQDAMYNCGVAYQNWGVAMKSENDKRVEEAQKKAKGKEVKEDLSYVDKLKAALPYLEKTTELKPNDAQLWQQIGKLYAFLNMKDKSKAAFERADRLSKGQ